MKNFFSKIYLSENSKIDTTVLIFKNKLETMIKSLNFNLKNV